MALDRKVMADIAETDQRGLGELVKVAQRVKKKAAKAERLTGFWNFVTVNGRPSNGRPCCLNFNECDFRVVLTAAGSHCNGLSYVILRKSWNREAVGPWRT